MKDSKKKSGKKKQKNTELPELDQLKSLTAGLKKMAKEITKLQKENDALKADLGKNKTKKKDKKKKGKKKASKEVVTSVMEPQVLPPVKAKAKKARKPATPKAAPEVAVQEPISDPTPAPAPEAKAKRGPKPKAKAAPEAKAKPGPKPKAKTAPKAKAESNGHHLESTAKTAVPNRPTGPQDLRFVQGLGAKIESLLNEKGVKTFADLAKSSQASVKEVLEQSGPRFKNQDPKPLIEQAKLIKSEKWAELETLQAELMKGKAKPGPKSGSSRKKGS